MIFSWGGKTQVSYDLDKNISMLNFTAGMNSVETNDIVDYIISEFDASVHKCESVLK